MRELVLIGYWHSEEEPWWPDPAAFVDEGWDPATRQHVLSYLKAGWIPWAGAGSSWCRFRCLRRRVGSAEHTDGVYLWPSGLAHYVEEHAVRLPELFVTHALSFKPEQTQLDFSVSVNRDWWRAQRGWSDRKSFLTPGFGGQLWLEPLQVPISSAVVRFLRQFPELAQPGTAEVVGLLRGGQRLVLARRYDYCDYAEMLKQARELGVALSWEEGERKR